MLKKLTYRQKLRYLALVAVLVLLLCYRFAFSRTLDEYRLQKEYKQVSAATPYDESIYGLLLSRDRGLDAVLSKFILDTADRSKNLLGLTGDFCRDHDLQVTDYKPYPVVKKDSLQMITRSITVQGDFSSCLRLLHHLETGPDVGRISAAHFQSRALPGNTATALYCTIYVQNLANSNHENE